MLEKYPGSTFLESDMEHCKKLLVSHNNHLLSLRHPIKLSPKRTPSVAVSPRFIFCPNEIKLKLDFALILIVDTHA